MFQTKYRSQIELEAAAESASFDLERRNKCRSRDNLGESLTSAARWIEILFGPSSGRTEANSVASLLRSSVSDRKMRFKSFLDGWYLCLRQACNLAETSSTSSSAGVSKLGMSEASAELIARTVKRRAQNDRLCSSVVLQGASSAAAQS